MSRLALLGVAALAVLAPLLVWWRGERPASDRLSTRPGAPEGNRDGAPSWRADDRGAYDLRVVSAYDLSGTPIELDLRAVLCTRVLEAGGGRAEVAMQLCDVLHVLDGEVEPARQAALGAPFVVRYDGGMPVAIEFPPGLGEDVRSQLREIVRTFQVTAAPVRAGAGEGAEWTALEEHDSGRYRAAYSLEPGGVWRKQKTAYLPVEGAPGGDRVRVLASAARLTPSRAGSWWSHAAVSEELELSVGDAPVAVARTRSSLEERPGGFDRSSDLARIGTAEGLLRVPVPVAVAEVPAPEAPGPATAEDRARFDALVAALEESNGQNPNHIFDLAELLERFPELAPALLPHLADDALGEYVAAGLVHALELAGTESCQEALAELSLEVTYPYSNRIRAIIGLGGVKEPTPLAVDALWQLSGHTGSRQDVYLGHTALLALGCAGDELRSSNPSRYAELSANLQATLQASAPDSRAVVLKAMYNLGDGDLLPVVEPELAAPESIVRAAAASAVASMDSPEAFEVLVDRLADERDDFVRVALLDGMVEIEQTSERGFEACEEMLRSERDLHVRRAAARFLIENLEDHPEGRKVLQGVVRDAGESLDLRRYISKKMGRRKSSRS